VIDFGFDKIALIGAVALIVIGPEKLPRVARTVGHFIGKARRYVADVKAEVNRSIELDELKKMKTEFESAARNVEKTVSNEIHQTRSDLESSWSGGKANAPEYAGNNSLPDGSGQHEGWRPRPNQNAREYKFTKRNWRMKRNTLPRWYKLRTGVKAKAQSGAARVARFRPACMHRSL
jgi:sec-independent protein translocase protein TatB